MDQADRATGTGPVVAIAAIVALAAWLVHTGPETDTPVSPKPEPTKPCPPTKPNKPRPGP
jgi:hypothetical protein